jgi:hypothetical protein
MKEIGETDFKRLGRPWRLLRQQPRRLFVELVVIGPDIYRRWGD